MIFFGELHWWRAQWCLTREGSGTFPDSTALTCRKEMSSPLLRKRRVSDPALNFIH